MEQGKRRTYKVKKNFSPSIGGKNRDRNKWNALKKIFGTGLGFN